MQSMTPVLPYAGGMLDQPGLLMDALNVYLAELDIQKSVKK